LTGEIIVVRPWRYHMYKWRQNGRKEFTIKLSEKASIKTQLCVTSDYCLLSSSESLAGKKLHKHLTKLYLGSGSVLGSFAEGTFSTSAYWLRTWTQK
jgi:hypothetical protein